MNLELLRINEKSEEERMKEIADNALVGIEDAWENHAEDTNGLSLSSDFSYQDTQKQLEARARAYGDALFRMARATTGRERMRYADGFSHFLDIVHKDVADMVLEGLLTNRETVRELRRKAREEEKEKDGHLRPKSGNLFSRWWKSA